MEVLSVIRSSLSSHEFDTWFAPAQFVGAENDVVVIRVPNAMFANHLAGEHRDRILRAFAATGRPMASIRCSVSANPPAVPGSTGSPPDKDDASPEIAGGPSVVEDFAPDVHRSRNHELPGPALRSDTVSASFSFDSFVVGASNRFAHSAALDVSNPGVLHSPYNPLLIYAEAGLGKTHLLQAIARRFLDQNPGRRVLLTRGDTFTSHVISAVRSNELHGFRSECAQLDMLLVDNIQFIAGLDRFGRVAEEFFHALTALSDRGRRIVLTSDRDPRDIPNLDSQIKSRLESGLMTDIGSPDWEMRTAIVRKKATTLGLELPDGVAETIASRYQNNVPETRRSPQQAGRRIERRQGPDLSSSPRPDPFGACLPAKPPTFHSGGAGRRGQGLWLRAATTCREATVQCARPRPPRSDVCLPQDHGPYSGGDREGVPAGPLDGDLRDSPYRRRAQA